MSKCERGDTRTDGAAFGLARLPRARSGEFALRVRLLCARVRMCMRMRVRVRICTRMLVRVSVRVRVCVNVRMCILCHYILHVLIPF